MRAFNLSLRACFLVLAVYDVIIDGFEVELSQQITFGDHFLEDVQATDRVPRSRRTGGTSASPELLQALADFFVRQNVEM